MTTSTIQILEDGNENTILRFVGNVTVQSVGNTVLADPATLSDMGPFAGLKAGKLRVKKIILDVEDGLAIDLLWDATTPLEFDTLVGRGTHDYKDAGGLQNNSGVGRTGKILYFFNVAGAAPTNGWDFAVSIYLGKQT